MANFNVTIPTLHADQLNAFNVEGRYKAIRCGRRWGKTIYGVVEALDEVLRGGIVGWFAPDYRRIAPAYGEALKALMPVKTGASSNKYIVTLNGGMIDFWSLGDTNAGRGREYDLVVVDEAAFAEPIGDTTVMDIFHQAIEPTLLIRRGRVIILSNTNGNDPENFFWRICNEPEWGFQEYWAPSRNNPMVSQEEIDLLKASRPPLVFAQEYEAEFVDWAGDSFFDEQKLLVDGSPVPYPTNCGAIYATIDTATKTGRENDGTAVVYWAFTPVNQGPYRLVILDWDIVKIEGALLTTWLPTIFQRMEALGTQIRARANAGAHIEDKASGMVLLQHARNHNWPATAIDSKLTAMGKSERAISVSGYVHQGLVKFSAPAYQKVTTYKGSSRNHLRDQLLKFRVGNKDQVDDDLLDCASYGIAIGLGNSGGF